jgi:uroporphyrinogen decarboxylase
MGKCAVRGSAAAICYFDPMSSPTVIPKEIYESAGMAVAMRTLPAIKDRRQLHFASALTLPVIDDVIKTGTAIIGVSVDEDLALFKRVL